MIADKAHFFCGVLKRVTDGRFEGTPDNTIRDFLEVGDSLDLELATICFEATTRIQLEPTIWDRGESEVLDMSIFNFVNSHHGGFSDADHFFITDAFLNFKKAIFDSMSHPADENDDEDRP